ncbi:MAG: hypothetical protein NVS9B9_23770 [Ktedonobacteraceae bacterium]
MKLSSSNSGMLQKLYKGGGHVRSLTLVSILLLLILVFTPSFVSAATKHGCASVTPPAVSGTLVQPLPTRGILFINEALLTPHSTWNCSEIGTYTAINDTWIEIYNAKNQPLDLYSVHTSLDGGPNTNPFYLPFGSSIAPYGFLVVFPRLDSNFLATETSTWRLLIGGIPVDEVSIPLVGEDQAYARVPDGSSTWVTTSTPTIDANNMSSVPTSTRTQVAATATARTTSGSNKSSGSSRGGIYGNGSSAYIGNGKQQVDGVQPAWGSLNHPDAIATSPATSMQPSNGMLQIRNNDLDVPHKILLTLLVTALAATLFWCWRLFRTS